MVNSSSAKLLAFCAYHPISQVQSGSWLGRILRDTGLQLLYALSLVGQNLEKKMTQGCSCCMHYHCYIKRHTRVAISPAPQEVFMSYPVGFLPLKLSLEAPAPSAALSFCIPHGTRHCSFAWNSK
jgi:hypothetical protein